MRDIDPSGITIEKLLSVKRRLDAEQATMDAEWAEWPAYIPVRRSVLQESGISDPPAYPSLIGLPMYRTGVQDWYLIENPYYRTTLRHVMDVWKEVAIKTLKERDSEEG